MGGGERPERPAFGGGPHAERGATKHPERGEGLRPAAARLERSAAHLAKGECKNKVSAQQRRLHLLRRSQSIAIRATPERPRPALRRAWSRARGARLPRGRPPRTDMQFRCGNDEFLRFCCSERKSAQGEIKTPHTSGLGPGAWRYGRVGPGISPRASLRTERETLASFRSHQAYVSPISFASAQKGAGRLAPAFLSICEREPYDL